MVLITGATGLVGSYIARYLVQSGEKVRALKRTTSNLSLLGNAAKEIEWLDGDIMDIVSLQEAMAGVDKVYHCAAVISFSKKEETHMLRTNGEGTANVVNTALDMGVKKLLYVSSVVSLGKGKANMVLDESEENMDTERDTAYSLSKSLGEMEVWRGMMEGLDAVIINPSLILGAGWWNSYGPNTFKLIDKGFPFYPPGSTGFVDVRDVAKAAIQLMESTVRNERFIVSAENLTYKEATTMIANALQAKAPYIATVKSLSYFIALGEKLLAKLNDRPAAITPQNVHLLFSDYRYSNEKIKQQIGFQFTPISKTIADTGKLFKQSKADGSKYGILAL